jgi:hypothetical protein
MFGSPGRSDAASERRLETQEYLRDVYPLVERAEAEYKTWIEIATEDSRTLTLDRDPDGQHAAIYLWRVGQPATAFVQKDPVRDARRFHEALALCLEARGAAADLFKEAADLALIKNPAPKIAEANRKLVEAERQLTKANTARRQLEERFGPI